MHFNDDNLMTNKKNFTHDVFVILPYGRGGGNRTPIDGFGDHSCTIQLHPYGLQRFGDGIYQTHIHFANKVSFKVFHD
jgi:hypothetical protein